jgi:hypothetical protein
LQALQEHIYFGRLDDEQSVLESLLELGQSVRRWNPRVLGGSGDDPAAGGEADKVGWCRCVPGT